MQTQEFTEILPLSDSQVVMQFNNIGQWRSDPRLLDLNDIAEHQTVGWKRTCISPALCDSQGRSVWSSDESQKNALFPAEAAAGALQYNTNIPSGLLLSNVILFPDGTRGDLHVDVDVPSEWASTPWLYYQAVNHRATGFNGDFLQINQLSPNYYNGDRYADGDFIRWYNPGFQAEYDVGGRIQPGNRSRSSTSLRSTSMPPTQANPMPTVKKTVDAIRISASISITAPRRGAMRTMRPRKHSRGSRPPTAPDHQLSGTNAQSASGKRQHRSIVRGMRLLGRARNGAT